MTVSVVIPAHDEERLLPRGLGAVAAAAERGPEPAEVVVVANRCGDRTAALAEAAGAVVVDSAARNLAAVRNTGVAASTGDVVVTVDADCLMSPNALRDVDQLLGTGRIVGGGTRVVPERRSAGIAVTYAAVGAITALTGLSAGMFWCRRADFDAVGGFDESRLVAEDLDFARRLRAHGRRSGRRFTMLRTAPLVASCRKFDRFGDWHMLGLTAELPQIRAAARGTDTAWVDRYFFDFDHDPE